MRYSRANIKIQNVYKNAVEAAFKLHSDKEHED
jgi:hypothetical protein